MTIRQMLWKKVATHARRRMRFWAMEWRRTRSLEDKASAVCERKSSERAQRELDALNAATLHRDNANVVQRLEAV